MIVDSNIFVILLAEKYFRTFTKKAVCNTIKDSEVIIALAYVLDAQVSTTVKNMVFS